MQTTVFFVQTLGLIMAGNGLDVALLDFLSLDFERTVGKCISPHSTVDRFYAKVVLTPVILVLTTVFLAAPLWNLLRRRLPAKVWDKLQSPRRATGIHIRRALLNDFLLCFAPLTKAAIDQLICVESCTIGAECVQVLAIDFGVSCSSTEFRSGAIAALLTLALCGLLTPVLLLHWARRSLKARNTALELRVADMERWFEPTPPPHSGRGPRLIT